MSIIIIRFHLVMLMLFQIGIAQTVFHSSTYSQLSQTSMDQSVIEIAVRKVKKSQTETFKSARSAFIAKLTQQVAAKTDREFESFYALPVLDSTPVFIGMTEWESMAGAGKAGEILLSSKEAQAFFSTFDFKAYVMVVPSEGGEFELATLASQPGQVLEIAVRRVKEGMEDEFQSSRKAFVSTLNNMEGVVNSWEFEVVGGQNTERLTVGMSVYENQEKFQHIAGMLNNIEEAGKYFSTFEPVALQYATSTTNN